MPNPLKRAKSTELAKNKKDKGLKGKPKNDLFGSPSKDPKKKKVTKGGTGSF